MSHVLLPSCPSGACATAVRHVRSRPRTGVAVLVLLLMTVAAPAANAQANNEIVINDIDLTNFQIVDNVLTATGTVTGTLAGLPFVADIENFALQLIPDNPATPAVECSVLNLELGPINLALLGLHVDTSPICLEITATEGGGLLGDLLCALAGGDGGLGIPIIPIGDDLTDLIDGLLDLLNGVLNASPLQQGQVPDSVCTGECDILELVLGPLDLSLLGLSVSLDDCDDGPVQVCVSATAGEGLLGNLLCGIAGTPALNLTLADVTQLGEALAAANADGVITRREAGRLEALLARLIR